MTTNTVPTEPNRQTFARCPSQPWALRGLRSLPVSQSCGLRFSATLVGLVISAFLALPLTSSSAGPLPGPWAPVFKGIDQAVGTNNPAVPGNFANEMQVVHCLRVDLTDPDVQLFATPRAPSYVAESRETLTLSVPHFLTQNKLQVAVDANYYGAGSYYADPPSEGISCEVYGLQIATGTVVSAVASEPDPRYASILFATNNQPHVAFVNRPPGTNNIGMYTAITGYYPIVSNGVNIGAASINAYPDSFIHQTQPRTAFGVSQDNRYLYLMTIDGRQSGYSDGALDTETAYWIMQFGAWNAINMDGGGSTAMYISDSTGKAVPVNHSSYVAAYGRERYIGSHFGVYAKPLPGTNGGGVIFDFPHSWSYASTNLDGVNWTAPSYDDSGWDGSGPGLLWVDARGPNSAIPEPLTTQMPADPNSSYGSGYPYITYYLRTHFSFTNSLSGVSLLFTDYIDDAAVFYLNGNEIYRLRMPPAPTVIYNSTLAAGYACSGDATCPDFFTISGDLTTNLVIGDNVLAAEVHNYSSGSPDITFGVALAFTQPYAISPKLSLVYSNGQPTLSWDGAGFTLQQAPTPAGPWTNTPGPVMTSPFTPTIAGPAMYFRLIK